MARPSKSIDTKISTPLFNLPLGAIPSGDHPTAVPQLNLLRHLTWSLPSGQAIAEAMGIPALAPDQLSELATFRVGLERHTPLWYYVLKEAELGGGARLTGVGARIVGEVFLVCSNSIDTLTCRETRVGGRRSQAASPERSEWSIC